MTRVFVSSTCYDLAQERTNIEEGLRAMGHEPILSEQPSFPIAPALDIVQNCKRVVAEGTDVFVLVVGGRRGSLDPETGKSVTNVEYDAATEADALIYVFVQRGVLEFLPVWKQNPDTDFSPKVDNPAVFAFIEGLTQDQRWIFPFDRAQDIMMTLRAQLSSCLKELIGRGRIPSPPVPPIFEEESAEARRLVRDRPAYWEVRLTKELLETKLSRLDRDFGDLEAGSHYTRTQAVSEGDVIKWIRGRIGHLEDISGAISPVLAELCTQSGPDAKPGDPITIQRAATKLARLAEELFEWEVSVRAASLPRGEDVRALFVGSGAHLYGRICEARSFLASLMEEDRPQGKREFTLTIDLPDQWTSIGDAIAALGSRMAAES